jgi:hypothetical protein
MTTKIRPARRGAALMLLVPAWLFSAAIGEAGQQHAQGGQAQERGDARGGGGGGAVATPHAGQAPSGGTTASGGDQTSGGQSSGGSVGSSGGRSEGGSRHEGATGGGGYAMPRDRGDRPSARPSEGAAAAPSGGGARSGGEGRYRGAPRDGGARTGDATGTRTGDGAGAGGADGVPAYARPREGRTPVGTAVPRGSVPANPPSGGGVYVPGGYYGGGYGYYDPWGYGYGGYPAGYGGGYGGYYGGYYDPWYGGYPASPQSSYTTSDEGSLKLKLKPRNAEVYVDGYFVGVVDDFDGMFQRLHLESGPHRVEVRAPGYETLAFDVRITADHTTTYQGELTKIP